jgi:hypothetical protein
MVTKPTDALAAPAIPRMKIPERLARPHLRQSRDPIAVVDAAECVFKRILVCLEIADFNARNQVMAALRCEMLEWPCTLNYRDKLSFVPNFYGYVECAALNHSGNPSSRCAPRLWIKPESFPASFPRPACLAS